MLTSIIPWLHSEENKELFREGAERAVDLEILFWDGIEDDLFGKD